MGKCLRQWGLVVAINLVAVVVAVIAFGAWKSFDRSQAVAPTSHVEGIAGFNELVDDVGYITKANAHVRARKLDGSHVVYDVSYTTGPDHFRVVPSAVEKPDKCVLLFGDSFTFGEGVNDDETSAAQIVKRSEGHVAAKNLAMSGWAVHQFLAGLQSGRFQRAITCHPTDAVYLMIPSHVYRAMGVGNPWDFNGPRYRQGPDGRPVRDGRLGDPPTGFSIRHFIGLNPLNDGKAAELTAAIVLEAARILRATYPGIRVHLLSWHNGGGPDEPVLRSLDDRFAAAGLMPIPLETIFPFYRFRLGDYAIDAKLDTHPNARGYRMIADYILRLVENGQG